MSRVPSHGESDPKTSEYSAWSNMVERCSNPRHRFFRRYGGRGITVCPEWLGPSGYVCFLTHIGRRPNSSFSLDRIDNDRGYEPGNVRWATSRQQSENSHRANQWTSNGRLTFLNQLLSFIAAHPGLTVPEMREHGIDHHLILLLPRAVQLGAVERTGKRGAYRYVSRINASADSGCVENQRVEFWDARLP